jgi:hypothetical protein
VLVRHTAPKTEPSVGGHPGLRLSDSSVARANLAHASSELSPQQRTERYTIRIANFGGDPIDADITGLQQMHRAFHAQVLEVR